MTIRQALVNYPKKDDESLLSWFRRIALQLGVSEKSVNGVYYQKGGREFVETQRKLDKNGNIISRVEKLQQVNFTEPTDDMELSRLSTNETTGQQWRIYTKGSQKKALFKANKELIEQSVNELDLKPLSFPKIKTRDKILRVIYTDTHVGMKIENPLYGGIWNDDELRKSKLSVLEKIHLHFDNHNEIHLIDLGDLVDGWNKETTRGGHKLPQNMTNPECFKIASKFKIELAKSVQDLGCKVVCHNVVNDNHGGDFSSIVNIQAKEVLSYLCPQVDYMIHEDFISHYIYKDFAFILTHGKDKEYIKYGFDVNLKPKDIDHINRYIDKHNLHKYKIIFEKGDSHQQVLNSSKKKFEYFNYMPLSPASSWVQHNFTDGRRGFTIMEIKNGQKTITPYEI